MKHKVVMTASVRIRAACLAAVLLALTLTGSWPVRAEDAYPPRNDKEYYTPYLFGEGFGFLAWQQDRLLGAESATRALIELYGEARVARRFFADMYLEGVYTEGMPMEPIRVGFLQENLHEQPDAAFRLEVFYKHVPREDWEVSVEAATRLHVLKTDIPAEFHGRIVALHRGFWELKPVLSGFFGGPEVRPMDNPVGGMTLGTFLMTSSSRNALTSASLSLTWWGEADPFQNLTRLRLGQTVTPWKRRITLRVDLGLDMRQVRVDQYEALFLSVPGRTRYLDLIAEATMITRLPGAFRVGVTGRYVPAHTPDEYIVRWYRPVYPEAGISVTRKVRVLQLEAGYTFAWVPPYPTFDGTYEDSGTGVIPESSPGHLLYVTVGLKI